MRIVANESEVPALCVRDQEVAEYLYARDRLEFFRIDKIRVERERIGFAEQLNEAAVFFDQVVGQHGDAEAALACAQDAKHVVHGEMRCARTFAVAADFQEPAAVLQMRRYHAAAE